LSTNGSQFNAAGGSIAWVATLMLVSVAAAMTGNER
jgi:hypothetical protein